jgi:hypothetical protein
MSEAELTRKEKVYQEITTQLLTQSHETKTIDAYHMGMSMVELLNNR